MMLAIISAGKSILIYFLAISLEKYSNLMGLMDPEDDQIAKDKNKIIEIKGLKKTNPKDHKTLTRILSSHTLETEICVKLI